MLKSAVLLFALLSLVEVSLARLDSPLASNTTAVSTSLRSKRQSFLYVCGQYPNQRYSRYPCYLSGSSRCENGGQKLGVGCTIANQCTAYYRGTVSCIRGCCCTVPAPTVQPGRSTGAAGKKTEDFCLNGKSVGFCPSGQLSQVRCSAPEHCQPGQTCMSGLCCTRQQNDYTVACGGNFAIAPCSAGKTCQGSYTCTASNYWQVHRFFPSSHSAFSCQCPVGKGGGRCNNGRCASGYTCQANGHCCAQCPGNARFSLQFPPILVMPYGQCVNGRCGGGRRCLTGNICC
ncbi:Protein Y41D4A [Aphelenchoides fujianensis]|nr:Protein Y41D4A [Aphelenchoides fujianensis]